ncbi:MAG TPA: hypothetical protein VJ461_06920, partial [Candidatus Nanoarchaeia archaeon]|nr:hypothetical protein [Candidatus Nanoarchaeia archaeon]
MRLLNKNKKAQEAHTGGLGDLIHIVLVVLLVLLVFGVGGALYAAVTGGGEQSSESNFDSLADNIQLMIDKPTSFEHQTMLFYLKEEKYLVAGLNAEKSSIPTSKYPKTCENKPCLCLYKDSGV